MKKTFTKILLSTVACSMVLLVLLFSVKKSFAATCQRDTCCTELPSTNPVEPLWESISHQFVSAVSIAQ